MKAKLKLYILLFVTVFVISSCKKYDPIPDISGPTPQTVLMFFPNSGNLHSNILADIEEVKRAIAKGVLKNSKLLVFYETKNKESTIVELYYEDGACHELLHYEYTDLDVTKAENIAKVWQDVIKVAPAQKYAMAVGAHGNGWLPASRLSSRRTFAQEEKGHWEYTSADGEALTRWLGGVTQKIDHTTLAKGIGLAHINLEYLLLDLCFMSSIEVVYDLRKVTKHIIASPCEVMAAGFPYEEVIPYMFTNNGASYDLQGICNKFYEFYSSYPGYPHGAIAVTVSSELDALAEVMLRINSEHEYTHGDVIQIYDNYSPNRFYDYGDYVNKLCKDDALLEEFEYQLKRAVPPTYRLHTDYFYSAGHGKFAINRYVYTGIMTSDPSRSSAVDEKVNTAWYKATRPK